MENIEKGIQREELNEITGWEHTTGFLPGFISTQRLESPERETSNQDNSSKYPNVKDKLDYRIE